jgi:TolB protein
MKTIRPTGIPSQRLCWSGFTALALLPGSLQASGANVALSIPVQITHALNYDPSPSPDGKRLAFLSVIAGREQIFTMDVDGKNIAQITRDDSDHEDPSWSPDGSRIAFVYISKSRQSIATVDIDGNHLDFLTSDMQKPIHPGWSADSRRVIYCTSDDLNPPQKNASEIRSVDVATKERKTLIAGGVNTYGSWSPDMKKIAYRKIIGTGNSEVFLADADGAHARNLTTDPSFDGWPAWSPDGTQLAFASNRRGHGYQIFVMAIDGTNVRLVSNTEGRGTAPRWSPDGKAIYFTNCTEKDYATDCEILRSQLTP